MAQPQRQREVRLDAPLVIDVNAGGVPSGVGNGIRGAIRVGKAYRDRRGHGQRIRIIRRKGERAVRVVRLVLLRTDGAELHTRLDDMRAGLLQVVRGPVHEAEMGFLEDERERRGSELHARIVELRARLERCFVVVPVHQLQRGFVHQVAAGGDVALPELRGIDLVFLRDAGILRRAATEVAFTAQEP